MSFICHHRQLNAVLDASFKVLFKKTTTTCPFLLNVYLVLKLHLPYNLGFSIKMILSIRKHSLCNFYECVWKRDGNYIIF